MKDKKADIISKLKEAKEKVVGEEKIKNVSRPDKVSPNKKKLKDIVSEHKKKKKTPTATAVGPRGGQFKITASGKKIYDSKKVVKKSMEDYLKYIEEIDRFINKFKDFKGLM